MVSSDLGDSGPEEGRGSNSKQRKTKGPTLYEILGITKNASDDDIKRAYRKLALRYHPDKNLENDPEKTERFKEINHAHAVLSVPTRRKVYDEYGDMGLKLMEQFGDDGAVIGLAFKPWFKWMFIICGLSTCCYFFFCCGCMFCCNCCCNFCCGKYKSKRFDEEEDIEKSDVEQEADGNASVIVDQPEESNILPKSTKSNENLGSAENSNEKLRNHLTTYPVNRTTGEAGPDN
ncbi:DnaJ domain family protein [Acanthocheilonema viteae]